MWGEPTKNGKEIFGFCLAVSDYKMSYFYFIILGDTLSLISPPSRRDEALPLGVLWQLLILWLRSLVVVKEKAPRWTGSMGASDTEHEVVRLGRSESEPFERRLRDTPTEILVLEALRADVRTASEETTAH